MSDIVDKVTLDSEDYIKELRRIAANVDKMAQEAERDFNDIDKKGTKAFKDVGDAAEKAGKKGKLSFDALKAVVGGAAGALTAAAAAVAAAWALANDAIAGVRVRRNFEALAAAAGTTGDAILEALTRATQGTIPEIELLTQANLAMQLGVAKTPAEFEKLARSALILGRSVGRGPVESLNDLINAAGRRSTEVLDNLGISLAEVNSRMEAMAQQEFGKTPEQLDQAARNALFMRAALDQAAEQAKTLGANVADIGSGAEAARARVQNLQQDVGEGFLILSDRAFLAGENIFNVFFGPDGVFPLFVDSANVVQSVFAKILGAFFATAGGIARKVNEVRQVLAGELGIVDFLNPARTIDNFVKDFEAATAKIEADFVDIFDPAKAAAGITPSVLPPPEVVDEQADELAKKVEAAQERLTEIERDGARDRLDEALKFERAKNDSLVDFAQKRVDQARKYRQKLADTETDLQRDLTDLERDQGRERLEVEQETAQARLDAETRYRRRLEDIRRQFDITAGEAAERRDAVAFLRAVRDRDQQVQQAQTDRERETQDAVSEASRRREELRVNQEAERSDALLAHERRLEDLRLANQREVDEIFLAEQRKQQELNLAHERRLEDLKTAYERQLADFKAGLEAEVLALLEAEAEKTRIVKKAVAERAALDRRTQTQKDELIREGRTVLAGRQHGGPVAAGQSYLVGESGPELFTPNLPGNITPSTMLMGTLPSQNIMNSISNDRVLNNNMGLVDPGQLDPIVSAKLENMLIRILGRME